MKKEHKAGLTAIAFVVLLIIGISDCGGNSTPTGSTSPIASASALASPPFTATSSHTPRRRAVDAIGLLPANERGELLRARRILP